MKNADTGTFDSVFRQKPPKRDLKLLGAGENITLVELCVFLPSWLKHGDISQRFWFDGLDRNHIVNIMNWHGDLARADGVTPNLITNWMNKSMRRLTGNNKWTHKSYAAALDRSNWDPTNLSLGDCKLNLEHEQRRRRGSRNVIDRVPFGSLGDHVWKMPQGVDGLDLTRFVQYARDHPQEELWFPQDFGYLAQKLGTVRVEKGHLGAEIAKRWSAPVAKDQEPRAARMKSRTGALQTLAFGETVAEGSHRCQEESPRQSIPVTAAHPAQNAAYPSYEGNYPAHQAFCPPHDTFYSTHDALFPSINAAYPLQETVDPLFDAEDNLYPILDFLAPASQQPVPEIATARYGSAQADLQASHWEDFNTSLRDELSFMLHEDLLNLDMEHRQTVESEFVGDSLAAAGIANSGPWLDDDDLAILYDKFQDLLYMAVPQHVNPRIFVKRW